MLRRPSLSADRRETITDRANCIHFGLPLGRIGVGFNPRALLDSHGFALLVFRKCFHLPAKSQVRMGVEGTVFWRAAADVTRRSA
jgi:hypothetical protein